MAYATQLQDHVEQRLPEAKYFYATVTFPTANTDVVVPISNTMKVQKPTDLHFVAVDQTVGGVVFRGTKSPTTTYSVLQATVAGIYRIKFFLEPWIKQ